MVCNVLCPEWNHLFVQELVGVAGVQGGVAVVTCEYVFCIAMLYGKTSAIRKLV